MRITTQMLSETARKTGLPINQTTLLDHINSSNKNNNLLETLNKKNIGGIDAESKKKYEKLGGIAEKLNTVAIAFLQEGENSLFAQAKESGDNQKIYDSIKNFFDNYNSNLKALRNVSDTMNGFYRQMLSKAPEEDKEELTDIGISFSKDGSANINMDKLKTANTEALENLFGSKSELVNKVKYISKQISNNAEASVKSYSNAYSSKGNLYNGSVNSRFDFRG